ncbi:hypothetical protein RSO01_60870 [Reyranella soli]|uniref:Uncharacterized protein n=1 Tax=Reyranella soli TaxID=1230389 RepID=A0A512NIZ7_9HYPH|nr:hypothetical protein RSO01_60870 [Reyranella soli]
MTKGATQPRVINDAQQPKMNRACMGAARSASCARQVRRGALGRLAAFHQDGANCHGEDTTTGCQNDEIIDHAFVPIRSGGRQGTPPHNDHFARFAS